MEASNAANELLILILIIMNDLLNNYTLAVQLFLMKGIVLERACDDLEQYQVSGNVSTAHDDCQRLVWRLADDRRKLLLEIDLLREQLIASIIKLSETIVIDAVEVSIRKEK